MSSKQPISIDDFPGSIRDIAEVLGLKMALKLIIHFGGVELRIPHKLKDESRLMVLGEVDAKNLCAYCPQETILVPVNLPISASASNIALIRQFETLGFKRWEMGRLLGLTQRHVRRIANKNVPAPNLKNDLFGTDN